MFRRKQYEVNKTFDGGVGNPDRNYKQYNEDPTTYKTDREDRKGKDRIFDTEGFKKAIEESLKDFDNKSGKTKKKKP